jgi:hypothetical protein
MKRIILTIALFISVVNVASAQFTIGPKAGLNLSKEHFGLKAIDEDTEFKQGVNLGLFGKYMISNKFDIQAELLYSQQGFKSNLLFIDIGGHSIQNGYKSSSHYFNIPFVLKYYPIKRVYIEAGPQVGYCFKSKISPDEYVDGVNIDYKTIDFSLVGGVGLDIGQGINLSARYNHGFTHTLPNTKWKNRVLQFSITYDLWNF